MDERVTKDSCVINHDTVVSGEHLHKSDRLPKIPVRSLVIVGGHDTVPVEQARVIDAGLPDSRLVVLEKSGHFPAFDEPEAFAAAILEFLEVGPATEATLVVSGGL